MLGAICSRNRTLNCLYPVMNFSVSVSDINRCFIRRLAKRLQQIRYVQTLSRPCTVGVPTPTSTVRKPVLFDGRGRGPDTPSSSAMNHFKNALLYGRGCDTDISCSAFRYPIAAFHTSTVDFHGEYEWQDPKSEEEIVQVHFVNKEGKNVTIRGKVGDNLLYVAKRFEVEMEDHDYLDLLPEATETEEDLLDQAPFLKENSRLGCQIILNKELDGIKLAIPAATKNFYVDGHKPTPH